MSPLDHRTSAFLMRFNTRKLPDGLQWAYLSFNAENTIERVRDFLNQHYNNVNNPSLAQAPFADDDISRLFQVDPSWPSSIRDLLPQLSLAVVSQQTRELVAVVLVRPRRIRYRGIQSIVISIPVMCVARQYRQTPLAAMLLGKCYNRLQQYSLADNALFFGGQRPFYRLHDAQGYTVDLHKQDEQIHVKTTLSDYMMEPYASKDARKVVALLNRQNDDDAVWPVYSSTECFDRQFSHGQHISSYCLFDMQRKLSGWFALRSASGADVDDANTLTTSTSDVNSDNDSVISLYAWAAEGLSAIDVVYFALRQALLLKARYLHLPYDMALSEEDQQRLGLIPDPTRSAYSTSAYFYQDAKAIKLFDYW